MGCNCKMKMRLQEYFQLFFWFGMLIGILSPIVIYYQTYLFFNIWPVIQRFFVLFSVNSSWLVLMSPIGYFLLQGKISNKAVSGAYSICLCMVIVFALVVIAFSQSQSVNMDDPEGSVVLGIRDYFDENGNIPNWLHDLQATEKCCGFSSGPDDWRRLIYPPDKPAIEDVPESCCITRVVGCNLILDAFKNKSELKHWIHTDGCRKPIERRLNSLLDIVSYGEIVMLVVGVILISIYWINLNDIFQQANDSPDELEPTQETENPEEFTATAGEESSKSNNPSTNDNNNNNNGVEEMEGCSESESPAAIPGSDLNSRRASFMAFSPGRSVQFRPSRNRLVITKSKSETNALNNNISNNNNTITTVTATTTDNNNINNFINNNNNSSKNDTSRSKSRNNIMNSRTMINQGSIVNQSVPNRSNNTISNKRSTIKAQLQPPQSQKQVNIPFQTPSRKQSSKSPRQSKSIKQNQRQTVLQEIIIETDVAPTSDDGEGEEVEEYINEEEQEEEEEEEDPGDRLNVRPVKTNSRIVSRKNSGNVGNNSRSSSKSRIRNSNSNKSVSNNKNSSTSTRRASSKSNQ